MHSSNDRRGTMKMVMVDTHRIAPSWITLRHPVEATRRPRDMPALIQVVTPLEIPIPSVGEVTSFSDFFVFVALMV